MWAKICRPETRVEHEATQLLRRVAGLPEEPFVSVQLLDEDLIPPGTDDRDRGSHI